MKHLPCIIMESFKMFFSFNILVSKCVRDYFFLVFSVCAHSSKFFRGLGVFLGGRGGGLWLKGVGIMTSSCNDSPGHWGGSSMDKESTKASLASIKRQSRPWEPEPPISEWPAFVLALNKTTVYLKPFHMPLYNTYSQAFILWWSQVSFVFSI